MISDIAACVLSKLREVDLFTVGKLNEIDSQMANALKPLISELM